MSVVPIGGASDDDVDLPERDDPAMVTQPSGPRHRKAVNTSAAGVGAPLPSAGLDAALGRLAGGETLRASFIAEVAANRPEGGKRRARAETSTRGHRGRSAAQDGGSGGRRARSDATAAVLLDASDAASHLALASTFWDASQILAHAEVARMALGEALIGLAEERDGIEEGRFSAKRRRALADIQRRAEVLLRAHSLLSEMHSRSLVVGD